MTVLFLFRFGLCFLIFSKGKCFNFDGYMSRATDTFGGYISKLSFSNMPNPELEEMDIEEEIVRGKQALALLVDVMTEIGNDAFQKTVINGFSLGEAESCIESRKEAADHLSVQKLKHISQCKTANRETYGHMKEIAARQTLQGAGILSDLFATYLECKETNSSCSERTMEFLGQGVKKGLSLAEEDAMIMAEYGPKIYRDVSINQTVVTKICIQKVFDSSVNEFKKIYDALITLCLKPTIIKQILAEDKIDHLPEPPEKIIFKNE